MSGVEIHEAISRRARQAVARLCPTAVLLTYHRVAAPQLDPQLMCVSAERFAEHLRLLSSVGECVSLRDLSRWIAVGRVPKRAIVVTFDGGYADNLRVAEPLLRDAGVPATVFVSSGGLEEGRHFWWDDLEVLLLHGTGTAPRIKLTKHGRRLEWASGHADAAYRDITTLCRGLAPDERDVVLSELAAQVGDAPRVSGLRRLTPAEVAELAGSPVMEVGAHCVSDTALSVLSTERRYEELLLSKRRVQEMADCPVQLLSYPFEPSGAVADDRGRRARDCGYMSACANQAGLVWRGCDPYQLPRFPVRDWDNETFERRLEAWFRGDFADD